MAPAAAPAHVADIPSEEVRPPLHPGLVQRLVQRSLSMPCSDFEASTLAYAVGSREFTRPPVRSLQLRSAGWRGARPTPVAVAESPAPIFAPPLPKSLPLAVPMAASATPPPAEPIADSDAQGGDADAGAGHDMVVAGEVAVSLPPSGTAVGGAATAADAVNEDDEEEKKLLGAGGGPHKPATSSAAAAASTVAVARGCAIENIEDVVAMGLSLAEEGDTEFAEWLVAFAQQEPALSLCDDDGLQCPSDSPKPNMPSSSCLRAIPQGSQRCLSACSGLPREGQANRPASSSAPRCRQRAAVDGAFPSSAEVRLHVYDLNWWTRSAGLSIFHLGVETYGREYSFTSEGIRASGMPGGARVHVHREAIVLGITQLSCMEVRSTALRMRARFTPMNYSVLRHNCQSFAVSFVEKLLGADGAVPPRFARFAGLSWSPSVLLFSAVEAADTRTDKSGMFFGSCGRATTMASQWGAPLASNGRCGVPRAPDSNRGPRPMSS